MMDDDQFIIEGPPSSIPLPEVSYGELIYQNLRNKQPEKPAMIDATTGRKISYSELLKETCSLAEAMRNYGCDQKSIIAICSKNSAEYLCVMIASLYNGTTVAPINSEYTTIELNHTLNVCKPKIIFCSEVLLENFEKLKKTMDFIEKIVVMDKKNNADYENLQTFLDKYLPEQAVSEIDTTKVDINTHFAFLMSSSGTTGLPKCVMLSHKGLNTIYIQLKEPNLHDQSPITLMVLPFFHVFGLFMTLSAIMIGESLVFLQEFDEKLFLNAIQEYKVTRMFVVPPLILFLNRSPLVANYNLKSLNDIICGAAPLKESTMEDVKKRLGINAHFRQGYGLTEVTMATNITKLDENPKFGSIGKIVPNMKMVIKDLETGKNLGPHENGELCFKGNLIMMGYYENEEATKNAFTEDGWFRSGDVAYYDEDGDVFITDRLKELIKFNGYQIAPAELEALLISHAEIIDSGVVGLPHERAGEVPVAFVVKSSNSKLTEEDVKNFVASRLSRQKWLRGGVIFVESIPKSSSGKILRRKLREMLIEKSRDLRH